MTGARGRGRALILYVTLALGSSVVDVAGASSWAVHSTHIPAAPRGQLAALSCTSKDTCTAVGSAPNGAGAEMMLAAVWKGQRWSIDRVAAPSGAASSALKAVACTSGTACMAVGSFTDAAGAEFALAERWNGMRWTVQPMPRSGGLTDVSCSSGTDCSAVGPGAALHWNGGRWSIERTASEGLLSDVSCTSSTRCIAVGQRDTQCCIRTVAERWSGRRWSILQTRNKQDDDSLNDVSCTSARACLAVGYSEVQCESCGPEPLVERWNGREWSVARSPSVNDDLASVSCTSEHSCSAVGSLTSVALDADIPSAVYWDGRAWSLQTTARPDHATGGNLAAVSCDDRSTCTAVGSFTDRTGAQFILAERRNLTSWKVQHIESASHVLERLGRPR